MTTKPRTSVPPEMEAQARYKYVDVPYTEQQARDAKAREIECLRSRIAYLKNELKDAENDLTEARSSELPTSRMEQITLLPGDPGYDECPVSFSGTIYQGDFAWINVNTKAEFTKPHQP